MKRLLFIICLLLNACSSLPKVIKEPPANDISYTQAAQDINKYKNAPVRWGGIIVDVENEQSFTLVQVLTYPLDSDGEPEMDKPHGGRFVFKTPEFLDPAVYTKNSEITVTGTLTGDIERAIGNKVIRMPLVSATTIYQWPIYDEYDNRYDGLCYGSCYGSERWY